MKLLIKQVKIIDSLSEFNHQVVDILIENNTIVQIAPAIQATTDATYHFENSCISRGWTDIFANFAEPGYEYKETLASGAKAAVAGGFTQVYVIPNTQPAIHNKSMVEYIIQKAQQLPVTVLPLGAVTSDATGKELAEMYDMSSCGINAFSDGINAIQSPGLLLKALQYVKAINGLIIQVPDDKSINPYGLMHEGIVSTQLGMPGRPAIAEELMVARDIELCKYTGSQLHITGISTKKSLDLIRQAKIDGIRVTCSVSPAHLLFTDEDLVTYNTNYKLNPPLRTATDKAALIEGIADGSIDCIASHHLPHETDSKILEFEYAKYGMISLQWLFAALATALPQISVDRWVTLLADVPAALMNIAPAPLQAGHPAVLTIFSTQKQWEARQNFSFSANTVFNNRPYTAKVEAVINKGQIYINE